MENKEVTNLQLLLESLGNSYITDKSVKRVFSILRCYILELEEKIKILENGK